MVTLIDLFFWEEVAIPIANAVVVLALALEVVIPIPVGDLTLASHGAVTSMATSRLLLLGRRKPDGLFFCVFELVVVVT